jgi:hypothetical protein
MPAALARLGLKDSDADGAWISWTPTASQVRITAATLWGLDRPSTRTVRSGCRRSRIERSGRQRA